MSDAADGASNIADRFDLQTLIEGLAQDLKDLRAGKISVRDAHARAALGKQILRGVHYVVVAQKFLEGRALPSPSETPATGGSESVRGSAHQKSDA